MKYVPDRNGTLAIAQSAAVGSACYRAGLKVQAAAEAVPVPSATGRQLAAYRAAFGTRRGDVTMARSGERRAGAFVFNDHQLEQVFGGRSRALYSALRAVDGVDVT